MLLPPLPMRSRGIGHNMKLTTSPKKRGGALSKLKPFKFPDGFVIAVDTREQKGKTLFDPLPAFMEGRIQRKTLHYGDYSICGFEDLFAIERKQMSDLYSYCGIEYKKKTIRKLDEFRGIHDRGGWVGLAIEASEAQVLSGHRYSKLPPEVVRQVLASICVKYKIHVYCNQYKSYVRRWVLDRALKFYKYKREERGLV